MAHAPTGSPSRDLARRRAVAFSLRARDMLRAAAKAELGNRRRVFLEAEARFRDLAEQQKAIARRVWSARS